MKFIAFWVLIFISLGFAYLNHWQLFEQDAFWLTRAGDEILKSFAVQTKDSWSYSVRGQEWINFQWLSSVVFSLAVKWGGQITALIWLRSLLSFVFFMICGVLILRSLQSHSKTIATLAILLLTPCIYLISWLRFQMRPDFFGMIFFATLIYVINFKLFSKNLEFKKNSLNNISKRFFISALALLVLWANFHSGTVILGIFLLVLAIFVYADAPFKQKTLFIGLVLATWLLTPQHWQVIKVLVAATKISNNPDLQPFQFKNILFNNGSFTYMIFWAYWVLSLGAYIFSAKVRGRLSDLYQSKMFFYLLTGVFTFLFLQRQRTIPYITLCLLPVASACFAVFAEQSLWLGRTSAKKMLSFEFHLNEALWGYYRSWLVLLSAICGLWFVMLPIQKNINVEIGGKVSSQFMPVKSVEFIDFARPNLNLYNYFNFGGYIIYKLHDYPVFYDGRETPFLEVGQERDMAARDPKTFATFLRKYNIQTVLESLPQGEMVKIYAEYYPAEEWARVYSDVVSTVYVRRNPDHQYLISMYEKEGAKVQVETGASAGSAASEKRPPKPTDKEIQKLLRETQEQLKGNF